MNIDTIFASGFALVTLTAFISMSIMTTRLPLIQERQVLINSILSNKAIAVFFALMIVPAVSFSAKGLPMAGAATMVLAGVAAMCMTRLSNRARLILAQRYA